MDYRKEAFTRKFENAGKCLGVAPDQIISLKLRDMVLSYNDYRETLSIMEHEAGVLSEELDDDFFGRGYLLRQGDLKIIFVEHETGLEILYIAGSMASLIQLIPLVLKFWNKVRGRLNHRHVKKNQNIEIRRIDAVRNISEMEINNYEELLVFLMVHGVENELKSLRTEIDTLSKRMTTIEKSKGSGGRNKEKENLKETAPKGRKKKSPQVTFMGKKT